MGAGGESVRPTPYTLLAPSPYLALTYTVWLHSEGAQDILKAYHKKIGGRPEPKSSKKASAKKGGKRSASQAHLDSPVPASGGKKRGRKSDANGTADAGPRVLPQGSWDDHVLSVHSVLEELVEIKGGRAGDQKKELIGLLHWKDNGPKTQHKMKVLRLKCPQRLLDYYEQHL